MENQEIIKIFNIQRFLNGNGEFTDVEFVAANCDVEVFYNDKNKSRVEWSNVNSSLLLSNGRDILNFNVEAYDDKYTQNTVAKLDTIIEVLAGLREAIIIANQRNQEYKKIKQEQIDFEEVKS